MPAMLRAVAAAASVHLAVGQDIVFLGSGACDGDDPACHDDPQAEKVLHAVQIGPDALAKSLPELAVSQDGLPAWLTPHGDCLFAMQPDLDRILPFQVGSAGKLTPGTASWSGGRNPVHATVSADGHFLLVANYDGPDDLKENTGATVASLRIGDGCSLSVVDYKNHSGHSVNPSRQSAAHVHSVYALRNGLIYSCDLGLDYVFTYKLATDGKLQELHRVKTDGGLGPRHLGQHPSLPILYVLCEMGQVILTYSMKDDGSLELLQTSKLSRFGILEGSKAAELAISPDGSAVFATNRGKDNSISVFNPDEHGELKFLQKVDAPAFPRGMMLANGGKVLLAMGQSKTELWTYAVGDMGKLTQVEMLLDKNDLPPSPAAGAILSSGAASVMHV